MLPVLEISICLNSLTDEVICLMMNILKRFHKALVVLLKIYRTDIKGFFLSKLAQIIKQGDTITKASKKKKSCSKLTVLCVGAFEILQKLRRFSEMSSWVGKRLTYTTVFVLRLSTQRDAS